MMYTRRQIGLSLGNAESTLLNVLDETASLFPANPQRERFVEAVNKAVAHIGEAYQVVRPEIDAHAEEDERDVEERLRAFSS